jgi:hypothetical protein
MTAPNNEDQLASLTDAIEAAVLAGFRRVFTSLPAGLIKDGDGHTIKAQSNILGLIRKDDGTVEQQSLPPFDTVPVHFAGGGRVVSTHPTLTGDDGLLVFVSRMLDSWHQSGGQQAPIDPREHHLSDSIFLNGIRSDPRKLKNYRTQSIHHRSTDAKISHDVHPDNGITTKVVDKTDTAADPFNDAVIFHSTYHNENEGIVKRAEDATHKHKLILERIKGFILTVSDLLTQKFHMMAINPDSGFSLFVTQGGSAGGGSGSVAPGISPPGGGDVNHSMTLLPTSAGYNLTVNQGGQTSTVTVVPPSITLTAPDHIALDTPVVPVSGTIVAAAVVASSISVGSSIGTGVAVATQTDITTAEAAATAAVAAEATARATAVSAAQSAAISSAAATTTSAVAAEATARDTAIATAVAGLAKAVTERKPSTPSTASYVTANAVMAGLAGTITPTCTGKVIITISGTIYAQTGTADGNGLSYQIRAGTGTAPSNGATTTGTAYGTVQKYTNLATASAAADVNVPFSVTALVTGLTVNTAVWIDLAVQSIATAGAMNVTNIDIVAWEVG